LARRYADGSTLRRSCRALLQVAAGAEGLFARPGQNFVPPMRSAVLFLKLASTGADLVFAAVFPSAWKLPDGLSQFVP
jgi:hypothetical protein